MPRRIIRSPSRAVVRGPRRQTRWLASADVSAYTAYAGGAVVLHESFSQATLAPFIPFTVVRTIGLYSWDTDQSAGVERPFGAFGFAVVTENARAAGVASLPTPILDENDDVWFVYQQVAAPLRFADATGFANTSHTSTFESRAQRKVVEGQSIVVMGENASVNGAVLLIKYRILIKLH